MIAQLLATITLLGGLTPSVIAVGASSWKVGFGRAVITPPIPVPLAGYAERTKASESTTQDIYVKAMALTDQHQHRVLLITCDFIGFRREISELICSRIMQQSGLERRDILLNSSHTHTGPTQLLRAKDNPALNPKLAHNLIRYTEWLQDVVVETALAALKIQVPANINYAVGEVTFPVNRRERRGDRIVLGFNPVGAVDRSVPVLQICSPAGKVLGIVFGAACHNTTLPRQSLSISGDFAGYAQASLEASFPGAQAMFVQGCGGNVGPSPTGKLVYARNHGQELAVAVRHALQNPARHTVAGPLRTAMKSASLPLAIPSRAQLDAMSKSPAKWQRIAAGQFLARIDQGEEIPTRYEAPITMWKFGRDLTLLAYSGEAVAEYATLAQNLLGKTDLWVAAYCNDLFGYLPTAKILEEGGYESRGLYSGSQFSPEVEQVVSQTVQDLAGQFNADQVH